MKLLPIRFAAILLWWCGSYRTQAILDDALVSGFSVGKGVVDGGWVHSFAEQRDGKMIAAGNFASWNGRNSGGIVRLNPDGSVDSSFRIGTGFDKTVWSVAVDGDGRVYVAGGFKKFDGAQCEGIGRLFADGRLDTNFTARVRAGDAATCLRLLPDGKVFVSGTFLTVGSASRTGFALLDPAGNVDSRFVPGRPDGAAYAMVPLGDGYLVGGEFKQFTEGAIVRKPRGLARLLPTGAVDSAMDFTKGADGLVLDLALLADGRIMVAGSFRSIQGKPASGLARLNRDGTFDPTFPSQTGVSRPDGAFTAVWSLSVDAADRVYLGGVFSTVADRGRAFLARLNSDGSVDDGFVPLLDNAVYGAAIGRDRTLWVGGAFASASGQVSPGIARLHGSDAAGEGFSSRILVPALNERRQLEISVDSANAGLLAVQSSTNLRTWRTIKLVNGTGADDLVIDAPTNAAVGFLRIASGRVLADGDFTRTALSTAPGVSMALRRDGSLWAFGTNRNGMLGLGEATRNARVPTRIPDLPGVVSVRLASGFGMAVTTTGEVLGWGKNAFGILGPQLPVQVPRPTRLVLGNRWQVMVAHSESTVAAGLRDDGSLWTLGFSFFGQGGYGNALVPGTGATKIGPGLPWKSVETGPNHVLGIRADDTLWAWGGSLQGEFGDGTVHFFEDYQTEPKQVSSAGVWRQIAAGRGVTLALRADGTLWSAGANTQGRLGLGTNAIVTRLTPVPGGLWRSVSAGYDHCLAIHANGSLWAWGSNAEGQLGFGTRGGAGVNRPSWTGTRTGWPSPRGRTTVWQSARTAPYGRGGRTTRVSWECLVPPGNLGLPRWIQGTIGDSRDDMEREVLEDPGCGSAFWARGSVRDGSLGRA